MKKNKTTRKDLSLMISLRKCTSDISNRNGSPVTSTSLTSTKRPNIWKRESIYPSKMFQTTKPILSLQPHRYSKAKRPVAEMIYYKFVTLCYTLLIQEINGWVTSSAPIILFKRWNSLSCMPHLKKCAISWCLEIYLRKLCHTSSMRSQITGSWFFCWAKNSLILGLFLTKVTPGLLKIASSTVSS